MKAKERKWAVVRVRGRDVHCVPIRDLCSHKKNRQCHCKPLFENKFNDPVSGEEDEPLIVIHDAYDGRE